MHCDCRYDLLTVLIKQNVINYGFKYRSCLDERRSLLLSIDNGGYWMFESSSVGCLGYFPSFVGEMYSYLQGLILNVF